MSFKLDKKVLEQLRSVDGFPIATDEDIVTLSVPPYYTACPNPWITDFIKEHGQPYDPKHNDYQKEPLTVDISEGKNDSLYSAHAYHTKVPHQIIMQNIIHYTKPGDVVFDGFCGTGMTGVAAILCGFPNEKTKSIIENQNQNTQWGIRTPILCDLSPFATFIAFNFNSPIPNEFEKIASDILSEVKKECSWMYETHHIANDKITSYTDLDGNKKNIFGNINHIIWSDVFVCPNCSKELVFWDVLMGESGVNENLSCSNCNAKLKKSEMEKVKITKIDQSLNQTITQTKQVPVLINYSILSEKKKRSFNKKPDKYDLDLIKKIDEMKIPFWYPHDKMMFKGIKWGDSWRKGIHFGITNVNHFFTHRTLYVLSCMFQKIIEKNNPRLIFWFTSTLFWTSKINVLHIQNYYNKKGGVIASPRGRLHLGSFSAETNPIKRFSLRLKSSTYEFPTKIQPYLITTQSSTKIPQIPNNSIDYIFTDPPFGENLMYSELNFLWESWLKVFTNNETEAIVNNSQKKGLVEYQELMEQSFTENYRILKPGRWMTIVFHNSQNKVWMAIQEALQKAGFVVADVRTLDKKKATHNQQVSKSAVKQDLSISVYKPFGDLEQYFESLQSGTEEGVWKFIDSHLKRLPIFVEKNGISEIITERQKFLLFDRMIAFHVQKGLTIPISAAEFYEKLSQKYPERDDMYFLADQIPEYDQKRAQVKSIEQTTIFVEDEKSTILWLNEQLKTPQIYQEIMPKFLKEIHQNKFEKLPELSEILEQNFLEDDKNKWHVPDPSKLKDLEQLREKSLLREFQIYQESKGKLKQFRLEAIRAGFKKKWSENNYQSIVDIANKLPEEIIQEDSSLLMYYDNAVSRLG